MTDLNDLAVGTDSVGMFQGLITTRAIRRYLDEPVPPNVLRDILFAATRAPTGSNRQPFRFVVLLDGPKAREARRLIGQSAREVWAAKEQRDGYQKGSGAEEGSPKNRMTAVMRNYVVNFESVPVVILPCLVRYRSARPTEGANIYPACQNILLAARALGYGGVMTGFQRLAEQPLRELLGIPDGTLLAGTITLGKPAGAHGPVRRRPMRELVFEDAWNSPAPWAVDPPGTNYTAAGPPASA
jgi:nitroreductase